MGPITRPSTTAVLPFGAAVFVPLEFPGCFEGLAVALLSVSEISHILVRAGKNMCLFTTDVVGRTMRDLVLFRVL